jgi:hypothetical protein
VSYKGTARNLRKVRREILTGIEAAGLIEVTEPDLRRVIRDDAGGDVLDAVIAAAAAWRAVQRGTASGPAGMTDTHRIEGWVFV